MLTFRIDDVSANTNDMALLDMVCYLKNNFKCEVWACLSMFSKTAKEGSVYPNPPFKGMEMDSFYNVNQLRKPHVGMTQDIMVSHGLFHVDHSKLSRDAQEMSIFSSCRFIGTDIFVPPFNKYDKTTERICSDFGIRLIRSDRDGWRSLEHNKFDSSHDLWYFHPWRYTFDSFKEKIGE